MRRCLLRLRRRPSFWLGLFVACFLAWAWWDSYQRTTRFGYGGKTEGFAVTRTEGLTYLCTLSFEPDFGGWGFTFGQHEGVSRTTVERAFERSGYRELRIPDSLVFFSFLGLWGGWLFWRWKREQRKLAA